MADPAPTPAPVDLAAELAALGEVEAKANASIAEAEAKAKSVIAEARARVAGIIPRKTIILDYPGATTGVFLADRLVRWEILYLKPGPPHP